MRVEVGVSSLDRLAGIKRAEESAKGSAGKRFA